MRQFTTIVCALFILAVGQHHNECSAFRSAVTPNLMSSRGKFGVDNSQQQQQQQHSHINHRHVAAYAARKTLVILDPEVTEVTDAIYDPLNLASSNYGGYQSKSPCRPSLSGSKTKNSRNAYPLLASSAALAPLLLMGSEQANAVETVISKDIMNPASFQPVCPASDNFYRFLQATVEAIVGRDKFIEYGPLIAGGLLRVRLELCVVESFFNEAVGPFIKENGVSWILPLHETVETFLAGSIFALATTFILVGSTKLLTVIATYFDLLVGLPSRTFGGFFYDRALGRPVTLDIGIGPFKTRLLGPTQEVLDSKGNTEELVDLSSPLTLLIVLTSGTVQLVGRISGFVREFLEAIDLFVGRYLVFLATFYIGVKFLHFKVFPDFP